jgi:hypothetical protein
MTTKQINVYTYDELSASAKANALSNFREQEECNNLADDLVYKLNELLVEHKIEAFSTPTIYYSLSHSQGDGVMFKGVFYYKSWVVGVRHNGRYYHENSKDLDITSNKTSEEAPVKVYDDFDKIYVDICKELRDYGYDLIDHLYSEENIVEIIDSNDYEFTIDGDIV